LAEEHGSDRLLEEFHALRNHQGLAVTADKHPLLYDAVGRGLLIAPSVELPGNTGQQQPFATLPYTLDRALRNGWNACVTTTKPKSSLDVAALCRLRRYAQHPGSAAMRLGYLHRAHRRRKVTSRGHPMEGRELAR
jgi:hypothetical protein